MVNICLLTKCGFKGSSGHSSQKQAFSDPEATDSTSFITWVVPIKWLKNVDSLLVVLMAPAPH